jgi:hypothetical protein
VYIGGLEEEEWRYDVIEDQEESFNRDQMTVVTEADSPHQMLEDRRNSTEVDWLPPTQREHLHDRQNIMTIRHSTFPSLLLGA